MSQGVPSRPERKTLVEKKKYNRTEKSDRKKWKKEGQMTEKGRALLVYALGSISQASGLVIAHL